MYIIHYNFSWLIHLVNIYLKIINLFIAPRKPIPNVDLDAMVAESMKDTHLDEEESDGEDDPELLV